MRMLWLVLLIGGATRGAAQTRIAFANGRWFNGKGFDSGTRYAIDGVLQSRSPGRVDTTIDLGGGYVVPPFAEGHNHNIEGSPRTDAMIARYLAEGIFSVFNPNSLPRSREMMAGKINVPAGIDVVFANGGLNATGGHPSDLAARNIARGSWPPEDGDGAFYHTIDDLGALERKWPAILAQKPDFIKIYLLYSNEYEKRRADTSAGGTKGLDPSLVAEIVKRAHGAGLRVAAHIENRFDFRAAIAGGVDILAHMPGYGWNGAGDSTQYALTAEDAASAARAGVTAITTLGFGWRANAPDRPPARQRRDQQNAANLAALRAAGVKIAIGSDNYGATALSEALYLSDLGVFSNLELLKMWSEVTPAMIFPKRPIGSLQDGSEASFVVLEADPLADFANTQKVVRRVKSGRIR